MGDENMGGVQKTSGRPGPVRDVKTRISGVGRVSDYFLRRHLLFRAEGRIGGVVRCGG